MNYPARTRRDNPPTRKRGFIENLRVIFQSIIIIRKWYRGMIERCCPLIKILSDAKHDFRRWIGNRFPIVGSFLDAFEKYCAIYELFDNFFTLIISLPIAILETCGIPVTQQLFSWCPVCTLCTFGAIIGVSSSVAVAVGVGLGVGLNCAETQYYPIQNVTNTTNINSAANINSTININSTTNSTG